MNIKTITILLNIPYTTFKEWNKVGHKKYELTLLLLGIDSDTAKDIIEKEKIKIKSTPKYSLNTKRIIFNRSKFIENSYWDIPKKGLVDIDEIVHRYSKTYNQINADTLCKLFGYKRVISIMNCYSYSSSKYNQTLYVRNLYSSQTNRIKYNPSRELEYANSKINNTIFTLTKHELEYDYLIHPKQRVIDYYCNLGGCEAVLEAAQVTEKYSEISQMVEYYKSELSIGHKAIFKIEVSKKKRI